MAAMAPILTPAVTPIFILGHVLNALYAIPSRRIDPLQPVVVSVGQVHGGAAENIIPNEVRVRGTIRSLDPRLSASGCGRKSKAASS